MRQSAPALTICLILFGLSGVLGLFTGHDPQLGWQVLPALLLSLVLYGLVVYRVRSWQQIRWFSAGLLLLGTAVSVYFTLQYGHQGYGETPTLISEMGQFTTFLPNLHLATLHPNAAAVLVEGFIPLALALLFSDPTHARRPLWGIIAGVMLYVLLLSFSRGAMVALAALPVLWLMMRSRWAFLMLGGAALLGIVALIVFAPAQMLFDSIFTRWELYRDSFYLGTDYLFTGLGLGENFTMAYSRYAILITVPRYTYSHNLYLTVWLGQGLLGLVSFSGMILAFYAFVRRVIRESQPRRLFHGAWLGVSALLIHGLFDARQYVEPGWLMPTFFLLLALSVISGRRALKDSAKPSPHPTQRPMLRWVVVGTVITGVILLGIFQAPLRAAWESNLGAINESQAELKPGLSAEARESRLAEAVTHYENALNILPDMPNAARRLGNIHAAQGDFDRAIPLLAAAYAQQPHYAASIKSLGLAYVNVGEVDQAVTLFAQLADVPEMREELLNWGYHYYAQEDPLRSAYAYESALQLIPEDFTPEVWVFIGDRYRDGGEVETARRWYTDALTRAPDHPAVLAALASLDE